MGLVAGTTAISLVAFTVLDCLPSGLGRSVTKAYLDNRVACSPNNDVELQQEKDETSGSQSNGCNALFWICYVLMGYASCLTNGFLPSIQSFSTAAYGSSTFHLAVTLSGIAAPVVALVTTAVYGYDQLGLWVRSLFNSCRVS